MEDLQIDWQVVGLTLNIVGVYFIVNSLIFKKPRRFLNEHFGIERRRPLSSIRNYVLSQVQLVIGFIFVIGGYFLQVAFHLANSIDDRANFFQEPSVLMIAAILVASTAMVTLVLKLCQIFWTRWSFKRLLMEFFRSHPEALDRSPNALKEVGEILGVERRKEDSVAEYLERLKAFLDIDSDTESARGGDPASRKKHAEVVGVPRATPTAPHPATPPRIVS